MELTKEIKERRDTIMFAELCKRAHDDGPLDGLYMRIRSRCKRELGITPSNRTIKQFKDDHWEEAFPETTFTIGQVEMDVLPVPFSERLRWMASIASGRWIRGTIKECKEILLAYLEGL